MTAPVASDEEAPAPTYPHRQRDAGWVRRVQEGDQAAFALLYEAWLDRVYDVVARIVRNEDLASEVTQDTFLTVWRKLDTLRDPDVFGGWLLRIARNTALNRLEREKRSAPADETSLAGIEAGRLATSHKPRGFGRRTGVFGWQDPADAAEELELSDLLWEAAEALGPRDLEVLDLHLRLGLTPAEIGEAMDLNRNAANQLVHRVRGRLDTAIRARVLWRGGQPACTDLAAALAAAGRTTFDADAIRFVDRHASGCDRCTATQQQVIAGLWSETEGFGPGGPTPEQPPSDLFATLPFPTTTRETRQEVDAALAAAGVPVGAPPDDRPADDRRADDRPGSSPLAGADPGERADGGATGRPGPDGEAAADLGDDGADDGWTGPGDDGGADVEVALPDVPGAPGRRPARPSGLFSTLGVSPAPSGVRRRTTLALEALGVPVAPGDPAGRAPAPDAPVADAPVADAPVADAPVADAPGAGPGPVTPPPAPHPPGPEPDEAP